MKNQFLRFLAAAVMAVGAALATTQTMAQSSPVQNSPNQQEGQEIRYSADELKTYAVAALEVQKLNDAYLKQLGAVEGEQAKKQLRKSAMDEMVEAVRNSGISLEKYNRITVESGDNSALSRKIAEHMQELQ